MPEEVVTALLGTAAAVPIGLRWLRVAQREHYLPGSVVRFWGRWVKAEAPYFVALIVVAAAFRETWLMVLLAAVFPFGLSPVGRTSKLAWTPRLRRLAAVTGTLWLASVVWGLAVGSVWITALPTLLLPLLVDIALLGLAPVERTLGNPWVAKAERRLSQVAPRVIAITGSYGKTSTKVYLTHLLGISHSVVATPASFNNRMGIAKAINEHLVNGTEFFVVEMGTYGAGEIADLCSWIKPEVAVITAVAPVHLERMGTIEAVVAAKREILENVEIAVLNVGDSRLAEVAGDEQRRRKVVRCATTGEADVLVDETGAVLVNGVAVGRVEPETIFLSNLACAVGATLAAGLNADQISGRLISLPIVEHRQSIEKSERGFTIIDDTFNSHPAGAALALQRLPGFGGKKVAVTPGMIELGSEQVGANESFGEDAANAADVVVIVGRTNRSALSKGAARGRASVMVVRTREAAAAWVRENLGPGDTVLYENDLPDHYP